MAGLISEGNATRPVSVVGVPRGSSPGVVRAAVRRAAETVTEVGSVGETEC